MLLIFIFQKEECTDSIMMYVFLRPPQFSDKLKKTEEKSAKNFN